MYVFFFGHGRCTSLGEFDVDYSTKIKTSDLQTRRAIGLRNCLLMKPSYQQQESNSYPYRVHYLLTALILVGKGNYYKLEHCFLLFLFF